MWEKLSDSQKKKYKSYILAFASITDIFAQKAGDGKIPIPFLNSKFQETAFQKAFNASAEDIGNTSYDAAIKFYDKNGHCFKYLVGIKTFGFTSGDQKIAQFKASIPKWSELISKISENSKDSFGKLKSTEEINKINKPLYLALSNRIATLRNERIESSIANLKGFKTSINDPLVESVYHVLMPFLNNKNPQILVGETSYTKIDIQNIVIEGCKSAKNPLNFFFTDGVHRYKFATSDSQLFMSFGNSEIVKDTWDVKYVEDAFLILSQMSKDLYTDEDSSSEMETAEPSYDFDIITESYSWCITNKNDEVEPYSGFNSFFGTGSKLAKSERQKRIAKINDAFKNQIDINLLSAVMEDINLFLMNSSTQNEEKKIKEKIRERIVNNLKLVNNQEFSNSISKLIFRPYNEMYIPIPNSKAFHEKHKDFFGKDIGTFEAKNPTKLALSKEERAFNLIFEPSGNMIKSYITQESGKAIESSDKQSYLGEWILRGVFQLGEYEQLTASHLNDIEINGIRLYKKSKSEDIHLEFIWIDKDNPPEDCCKY